MSSSPSSCEKDGRVPVFLGRNLIIFVAGGRAGGHRLPDSGEGDVRMRRLLTVAGAAAGVEEGAIDLCDFPACIFRPDSVLNDLSHWSH